MIAALLDNVTVVRPGSDSAGFVVFRDLTAEVQRGEVVAVAGQPGFGGTLLAQTVAGLRKPADGTVDAPRTAFVPSGGGLLPQLSLRRNVVFGERLRGGTRAASTDGWLRRFRSRWTLTRSDEHDVDRWLERFGLADIQGLVPDWVNGTQRLLTALARALLRRPETVVVDATSGPDPDVAYAALLAALAEIDAGGRIGVLLCTSRPALLEACDRIVVIGDPADDEGADAPVPGTTVPGNTVIAEDDWERLSASTTRSVLPVLHGDPLLVEGDTVWRGTLSVSTAPRDGDAGRRFRILSDPDPTRFQDVEPVRTGAVGAEGGLRYRLRLPPGESAPRGSLVTIEYSS